jgi:CelD/BcsL family acetyltransferase involved in cellulose biosynthesis
VAKAVPARSENDLPVACALGPSDRVERVAAWRALCDDALAATTACPDSFEARFRDSDGNRARVEQLVALERQCCAFLCFELERADGFTILRIKGTGAEHTGAALLGARVG